MIREAGYAQRRAELLAAVKALADPRSTVAANLSDVRERYRQWNSRLQALRDSYRNTKILASGGEIGGVD